MKSPVNHRLLLAALVGGLALSLMPVTVEAAQGTWLDQITEQVKEHQEFAGFRGMEQAYDPYLEQLKFVRWAFTSGDEEATYVMMNKLMDMLEAKVGGIPDWSAKMLFDFCGRVTPVQYHDFSRHLPRV